MVDQSDHDLLVRIDQRALTLEQEFGHLKEEMERHIAASEKLHQDLLQRATANELRATNAGQRTKAVEVRTTKLEDQNDSHATAIIASLVVGGLGLFGVVLTYLLAK
jgi:hypothetical protein